MSNPVADFLAAHDAAEAATAAARDAIAAANLLAQDPQVIQTIRDYASTAEVVATEPETPQDARFVEHEAHMRRKSLQRVAGGETLRPTYSPTHEHAEFDSSPSNADTVRFTNIFDGEEWHHVDIDVPRSAFSATTPA